MQSLIPTLTRFLAAIIGLVWCTLEPSLNYIAVCFFALVCDCYTAWRCNCRIYSRYREAIKKDPRCKIDGKLKSKKMAKMVKDFSVLILAIFLATMGRYRDTRLPEPSPSCQLSCRHLLWRAAREHPRKREHLQWGTLGKSDAEDCGR